MEIGPSDEVANMGHEKSPSPCNIVIGEANSSKLKQPLSPIRAYQQKGARSPPMPASKHGGHVMGWGLKSGSESFKEGDAWSN